MQDCQIVAAQKEQYNESCDVGAFFGGLSGGCRDRGLAVLGVYYWSLGKYYGALGVRDGVEKGSVRGLGVECENSLASCSSIGFQRPEFPGWKILQDGGCVERVEGNRCHHVIDGGHPEVAGWSVGKDSQTSEFGDLRPVGDSEVGVQGKCACQIGKKLDEDGIVAEGLRESNVVAVESGFDSSLNECGPVLSERTLQNRARRVKAKARKARKMERQNKALQSVDWNADKTRSFSRAHVHVEKEKREESRGYFSSCAEDVKKNWLKRALVV